jgi:hypothetical protein
MLWTLLLSAACASQLYAFLNDIDDDSHVACLSSVSVAAGVVSGPIAQFEFDNMFTANACGTFGSGTYSCVTGFLDLNETTWSAEGEVVARRPIGNTFPLYSEAGTAAAAATLGPHVYAVITVPSRVSKADALTLFADGVPVFNTTVPAEMGVVDFLAAGPVHAWFGLANASVGTHWDQSGSYSIVGYPVSGQGSVLSVNLTGIATWSNCNWDGTKQLLCLSKLVQDNGPTSIFAINDASGAVTMVCPTIRELPAAFFPTATAYDPSASAWYVWGYVQDAIPFVPSFYKLDASCLASQIALALPAGYKQINALFVLNQ